MKNEIQIDKCPLRKALAALGGKWNLIIIKNIGVDELRFGELKRLIPDITEKVLIDKLKVLISYGIIIRKNFNEIPPKVSYKLSKTGFEALNIVEELECFGGILKNV